MLGDVGFFMAQPELPDTCRKLYTALVQAQRRRSTQRGWVGRSCVHAAGSFCEATVGLQ